MSVLGVAGATVGTADTFFAAFFGFYNVRHCSTYYQDNNSCYYNIGHFIHLPLILFESVFFPKLFIFLDDEGYDNSCYHTYYRPTEYGHPDGSKSRICEERAEEIYEES